MRVLVVEQSTVFVGWIDQNNAIQQRLDRVWNVPIGVFWLVGGQFHSAYKTTERRKCVNHPDQSLQRLQEQDLKILTTWILWACLLYTSDAADE